MQAPSSGDSMSARNGDRGTGREIAKVLEVKAEIGAGSVQDVPHPKAPANNVCNRHSWKTEERSEQQGASGTC